ncbi:sulfiredoxin, partial [Thalictrum thalictroides]
MAHLSFNLLNTNSNFRTFSIKATSSNGVPSSNSGSALSKKSGGGPVILELPLDKIRRPLMRTRSNDPQKVQDLMDSIRVIGLQEP